MTEVAKTIHLDKQTGIVTINGEPLGYYLANEPVQVTVDPSGANVVRLPLICDEFSTTAPAPTPKRADGGW